MAGADPGRGASPGVVASLRRLVATAVAIVQTRLELLANELEEERVRLLQVIALGALALLCAVVGALLLSAWLVAALWDQYRLWTLGLLALAYLAGAVIALRSLRARIEARSKIFSDSLAEFRRDRDLLER